VDQEEIEPSADMDVESNAEPSADKADEDYIIKLNK
jgi:hypothetical protein